MEQYGYHEEYYSVKKKSSKPVRIIKIVLFSLIALVIALLILRILVQDYYPAEMEELFFNPTLEAHYRAAGEDFAVYTQDIRIPYDDNKVGNFFSAALFLIPDARQLQITVRYSGGTLANLKETYGEEALAGDEPFIFTLADNRGNVYPLSASLSDEKLMYEYRKLVFDGVELPLPDEIGIADGTPLTAPSAASAFYMYVNVYLQGEEQPIARLPIYETHLQSKDQQGVLCLYTYRAEVYTPDEGELPS